MFRVLRISGDSLLPDYREGDFVVVSKIPYLFFAPAVGDVVVFRQPGYGLLIKAIQCVDPRAGTVEVRGTYAVSVDSQIFGSVALDAIVGKVVAHIARART